MFTGASVEVLFGLFGLSTDLALGQVMNVLRDGAESEAAAQEADCWISAWPANIIRAEHSLEM